MTNAIELNHISKSFGEFSLKDVTLAVPAGTICGLVGENGAGKSTLIRILMGALRPDSGTAAALGVDVSAPEFLNAKEDIGVVLDEGCFPETLTAPQVGHVMAATYRRWEQDTFDAYCRRFALPEKTAFKDYSRGMKMKLTIAVALSHQARLLVLDEATAGLDPIVRDEILELFNEFTRDETHSVLISSPHSQRFGKALRLHRLSPSGAAAVLRGKGRPSGAIRHLQRHSGASGGPHAGSHRVHGDHALRRCPGAGAAGAGPGGLPTGKAHH